MEIDFDIYRSKPRPETRPGFPCEAFRTVLRVGTSKKYGTVYVDAVGQYKFPNEPWHDCVSNHTSVGLQRRFELGYDHSYYDGDHYVIYLGFMFISFSR